MALNTGAFDGYLADFESAREEAQKAIDDYSHCVNPAKREEIVLDARSAVDEVERYIRILENEAKNGTSTTAKRKMTEQTHHCRTQWTSLKSSLEKAILVGDARAKSAGEASTSSDPKEQAVRYAERLDRNGRHLDEAQRTLAATEAIAINVSNNLEQQRNHLEHARIDVDQAREDTEEAGSHLRRLTIKAITNKIVLLFIILCLMVAIALVSYYKWYPRNKKDYTGLLPHSTSGSNASSSSG